MIEYTVAVTLAIIFADAADKEERNMTAVNKNQLENWIKRFAFSFRKAKSENF